MPYDFRSPEEKYNDEQQELHEQFHGNDLDPHCWRCAAKLEELATKLCVCGHDREDEHRNVEQRVYDDYIIVRICDVCGVDCRTLVGEREAFEAKTAEINAKAKPKVEAEVKAWLEQAPYTHIEPKK